MITHVCECTIVKINICNMISDFIREGLLSFAKSPNGSISASFAKFASDCIRKCSSRMIEYDYLGRYALFI